MTSTEDRNLIGVTGKNSILHLIFTNDAENFKDYWPIIMAPISNHNRISFNIYDTSGEHKHFKNSDWPEVLKYNVSNGGLVKMRTEWEVTNCNWIFRGEQSIENTNKNFTKALIDVAKKVTILYSGQGRTTEHETKLIKSNNNWWQLKHREKSDLLELQIG